MSCDIKCPYCNKFLNDNDYWENEPQEIYEKECPHCYKIMMVSYEMNPTFITHDAPCKNGGKHDWVPMTGAPVEYFAGRTICTWCDEVKVEKEVNDNAMNDYRSKLKSANKGA